MRQILYTTLFALILMSCAPQKQLNRLLSRHPELKQAETTITVRDTIYFDASQKDTTFDIGLLAHYDSVQTKEPKPVVIAVTTGRARASIIKQGNNNYLLRAEQLPDTVTRETQVNVPRYQFEEVPKKRGFTFWAGVLSTLIVVGVGCFWVATLLLRIFK